MYVYTRDSKLSGKDQTLNILGFVGLLSMAIITGKQLDNI
jgi:hypothetical protein